MFFYITASKDTYIQDKIIENNFSASDANVGRASTLDIYRLYDESFLSGVNPSNELSRALIKFDFDRMIGYNAYIICPFLKQSKHVAC